MTHEALHLISGATDLIFACALFLVGRNVARCVRDIIEIDGAYRRYQSLISDVLLRHENELKAIKERNSLQ